MAAIKARCAYSKCRKRMDVKNVGHSLRLPKAKVNLLLCRALRPHCKAVKFCSESHKVLCAKKSASGSRGGREPLTIDQFGKLFQTLQSFAPWAAMLALLQLCIGDRADCCRRCCWSWLKNLDPSGKGAPSIQIPKVNGKTVARDMPLHAPFAQFLWETRQNSALVAPNGQQWPHSGQPLTDAMPLFPGFNETGQKRDWAKPISNRAYLQSLTRAADILRKEVRDDHESEHVFAGFELDKLGTHSFKKTAVTLMAESKVSWSVISKITGTSVEMLQRTYDIPTRMRQKRAMSDAFERIQMPNTHCFTQGGQADNFCGTCGKACNGHKQKYCTQCGATLHK